MDRSRIWRVVFRRISFNAGSLRPRHFNSPLKIHVALKDFALDEFLHQGKIIFTAFWNAPDDHVISFGAVFQVVDLLLQSLNLRLVRLQQQLGIRLLNNYQLCLLSTLRQVFYVLDNSTLCFLQLQLFSLLNISVFAVMSTSILARMSSSLRE